MRDYSDKEKKHYQSLAALVVKTHRHDIAKVNASAKVAIKVLRDNCPDLDDDALVTVMTSICYLMVRIMQLPMAEAWEMIEGVFDNYALAVASMLGVYDLDSTVDSGEEAKLNKLYDELVKRHDQETDPFRNTGQYL